MKFTEGRDPGRRTASSFVAFLFVFTALAAFAQVQEKPMPCLEMDFSSEPLVLRVSVASYWHVPIRELKFLVSVLELQSVLPEWQKWKS
jgi:hypothetical protein